MASKLSAKLRGYVQKPKTVGPAKKSANPFQNSPKGVHYPAASANPATPGASAAPPPPAAAVPATPAYTPTPWDGNYESTVANINRRRSEALAGLNYEETRTKQDYGFDDPSNPFNRLKMLERSYQQSKAGAGNSMAAGGQLYSGAYQQAQDQLAFGETQDRDSLRRSYDDVLAGIQQRRLGVNTDADIDITGADYQRILAALQSVPVDPGPPAAPAAPAAAPNPVQQAYKASQSQGRSSASAAEAAAKAKAKKKGKR